MMGDIDISSDWPIGNKIFPFSCTFSGFAFIYFILFAIFEQTGPVPLWSWFTLRPENTITKSHYKTGRYIPYSLRELRPLLTRTEKMQEKGPTVYHPHPRRIERLTIFRCHCKDSTFSTVILRPWVGLGLEPSISRKAIWRSTTWSKHELTKSGYSFLELISLLFNSATRLRKYSSKIKQVQYLTEFILTTEDRSLIITRRSFTE